MLVSSRIKLTLVLWVIAECLVFAWVAQMVGFPVAMLLAFLTSLLGWTLLKRTGAAAMVKVRAMLDGRVASRDASRFLDDTLATFGALALLTPGFVSDAIGLALSVPAVRDGATKLIGRRADRVPKSGPNQGSRQHPATIELGRDEWTRTDMSRNPMSET